MRNSSDPSVHKSREHAFVAHVERLLEDGRLMVDTTRGRRTVTGFLLSVDKQDRATELKRTMSEMDVPDRQLQERMPVGRQMNVTLQTVRLLLFRKTVGHIKVICTSPLRQLIGGEAIAAMKADDIRRIIAEHAPPDAKIPTTLIVVSTSGFSMDARELYERRSGRTVILAEPNDAGGWSIHGPNELKALTNLLDPEESAEKRRRVHDAIEQHTIDLLTGGISSDKIASATQLPLQSVEAEVKSYARERGLAAKRIDGRVVLFREGSIAPSATPSADAAGGAGMPLIDRLRSFFGRKGENEKKIAFLSERRAALSQQRDRAYEEIHALEAKDEQLQNEFKAVSSPVTRRRVTSQLVQLRKDIERRQQLLQVLNQQINVVSTHLHNIELVQQGQGSKLPDSEEIAEDAAAAEEMLAQLQADNELADSVSGVATAGMSAEEQALYAELEAQAGGPETTHVKLDHVESEPNVAPGQQTKTIEPARPAQQTKAPRPTEPEAG